MERPRPQNTPECEFLPVLVPGFTPKQMSRLATFEHMVRLVNTSKLENRMGEPSVFGFVQDGKMKTVYFRMDSHFVMTMSETIEAMYRDELSLVPHIKEAADDIVNRIREEVEGPTLNPDECQDLFERE